MKIHIDKDKVLSAGKTLMLLVLASAGHMAKEELSNRFEKRMEEKK